jgi:DNA-binding protein H-NS
VPQARDDTAEEEEAEESAEEAAEVDEAEQGEPEEEENEASEAEAAASADEEEAADKTIDMDVDDEELLDDKRGKKSRNGAESKSKKRKVCLLLPTIPAPPFFSFCRSKF